MAPIRTDSAVPERLDESNPITEIKEEMISVLEEVERRMENENQTK